MGGNLAIDSMRQIFILFGDMAWILATIRWLNVGEVSATGAAMLSSGSVHDRVVVEETSN